MKKLFKRFIPFFACIIIAVSSFSGCLNALDRLLFTGNNATGDDITISFELVDDDYVFTVVPHYDIENLEITVLILTLDDEVSSMWEFYVTSFAEKSHEYTFSLPKNKVDKAVSEKNIKKGFAYDVTAGKIVG